MTLKEAQAGNQSKETILIVDDSPVNTKTLFDILAKEGYTVLVARDGEDALKQAGYYTPDLIMMDVMMPVTDGLETCKKLKNNAQLAHIPVIFMTAITEAVDKAKGFEVGGVDFVAKPFQREEVLVRIQTHLYLNKVQETIQQLEATLLQNEQQYTSSIAALKNDFQEKSDKIFQENLSLKEQIKNQYPLTEIITQHLHFKKHLYRISAMAETSLPVLIQGEPGTQKELLARAIHQISPRQHFPVFTLDLREENTPNFSAHLAEMLELHQPKANNLIAKAHCATLILLEVGALTLEAQKNLLHFLKKIRSLDPKTLAEKQMDIRLIATTGQSLETLVHEHLFSEELYLYLNGNQIIVPPLRKRRGDIPLLTKYFIKKHCTKLGKDAMTTTQAAMRYLEQYDWPGNVAQLEAAVSLGVLTSPTATLDSGAWLPGQQPNQSNTHHPLVTLREAEKQHILSTLQHTKWKVSGKQGAAEILDINPKTLESRMKKLGISRS